MNECHYFLLRNVAILSRSLPKSISRIERSFPQNHWLLTTDEEKCRVWWEFFFLGSYHKWSEFLTYSIIWSASKFADDFQLFSSIFDELQLKNNSSAILNENRQTNVKHESPISTRSLCTRYQKNKTIKKTHRGRKSFEFRHRFIRWTYSNWLNSFVILHQWKCLIEFKI